MFRSLLIPGSGELINSPTHQPLRDDSDISSAATASSAESLSESSSISFHSETDQATVNSTNDNSNISNNPNETEEWPFTSMDPVEAIRMRGGFPPPGNSHLPCPFKWDGCEVRFDIKHKQEWILHSLGHFGPNIAPPNHLVCTFENCRQSFNGDPNKHPMLNWKKRMDHYAEHIEKKVESIRAEAAQHPEQPDFEMRALQEISETVDVNLRQYMVENGLSQLGIDADIRPNPPSALDSIPRGLLNHAPLAFGGPRFTEVVHGPFDNEADEIFATRTAMSYIVEGGGRRGREGRSTLMHPARTAGEYSYDYIVPRTRRGVMNE